MNKAQKAVQQLELDERLLFEVSHRGGHCGAYAGDVVAVLFPNHSDAWRDSLDEKLPGKVGVYCNYLGGGLRGAIAASASIEEMEAHGIAKGVARQLAAFMDACGERYLEMENELGLNDETYPDGDTNWDAFGTNRVRKTGVISAY